MSLLSETPVLPPHQAADVAKIDKAVAPIAHQLSGRIPPAMILIRMARAIRGSDNELSIAAALAVAAGISAAESGTSLEDVLTSVRDVYIAARHDLERRGGK